VDDSLDLDTWFKREILAHEAALVRYLNRVWFKRDEVHDLRQEIYVRVYEAAGKSRPASAKAFLFATARNLMADRVRRGRVVSIEAVGDLDTLNVLINEISPERHLSAWQELRRVSRALNRLPPKCREIVWLRKVDQLSTREVAEHLGLSERTVESQILKGMQLLGDAIFGTSASPAENGSAGNIDDTEAGHGE